MIDVNLRAIAKTASAQELARLKAYVEYYFNYSHDRVAYLEGLRRWCEHRGENTDLDASRQDVWTFMELDRTLERFDCGQGLETANLQRETMSRLTSFYLEQHAILHQERVRPELYNVGGRVCFQDIYSVFTKEDTLDGIGWNDEDLKAMYNKVVLTPGGYFSTRFKSAFDFLYELRQLRVITELKAEPSNGQIIYRHRGDFWAQVERVCKTDLAGPHLTMETLPRIFGLPKLPGSGRLAYCVETDWAVQAALNAEHGIGPLERAAVLEELYIY